MADPNYRVFHKGDRVRLTDPDLPATPGTVEVAHGSYQNGIYRVRWDDSRGHSCHGWEDLEWVAEQPSTDGARRFWERAFLAFTERHTQEFLPYGNGLIHVHKAAGHAADNAVVQWRKRWGGRGGADD